MTIREQETIKQVLKDTGIQRNDIARELGVSRSTVDRWAATGHIAKESWIALTQLSEHRKALNGIAEFTTEALTNELKRRGYSVRLER